MKVVVFTSVRRSRSSSPSSSVGTCPCPMQLNKCARPLTYTTGVRVGIRGVFVHILMSVCIGAPFYLYVLTGGESAPSRVHTPLMRGVGRVNARPCQASCRGIWTSTQHVQCRSGHRRNWFMIRPRVCSCSVHSQISKLFVQ